MRWVSVSRAALHRAGLRRVALPAAGWPGGARRGASGGGGDDNPYFPAGMPQELKDSIMLWYDLERQKATNESMALSPILKDLSGNGNDATCYNFGWSGMSGIGGYNYNVNNAYKYYSKYTIIDSTTIHFNKVTFTPSSNKYILYFFPFSADTITGTYTIPSLKVKIDNPNNANLQFGLNVPIDEKVSFNDSRVIEVPEKTIEVNNRQIGIGLFYLDDATDGVDVDITLTILPEYPNALVSDGVDDYAFVQDKYDDEGNLINKKSLVLNKEDGYTVIAKRKWLKETLTCGFISKIDKANNTKGAFGFELSDTLIAKVISNWGKNNPITLEKNDITYGTTTKYNSFKINIGNRQTDTDYISIFNFAKDTKFYGQLALYSLILFNRDLTDEEIEWVKKNMIESGED